MLTKPDVQARVRRWVELGSGIQPKEILGRLGDRARADITDLVDENGRFDLLDIRRRGLGHLIKSVTVRQEKIDARGGDEEARAADVIKIELHDSQKSDEIHGRYIGIDRMTPVVNINLGYDNERQVRFLVATTKKCYKEALDEGEQISIEGVLDELLKWEKEFFPEKNWEPLKPIILERLADESFGIPAETAET